MKIALARALLVHTLGRTECIRLLVVENLPSKL
jgi:hypothetical protein